MTLLREQLPFMIIVMITQIQFMLIAKQKLKYLVPNMAYLNKRLQTIYLVSGVSYVD